MPGIMAQSPNYIQSAPDGNVRRAAQQPTAAGVRMARNIATVYSRMVQKPVNVEDIIANPEAAIRKQRKSCKRPSRSTKISWISTQLIRPARVRSTPWRTTQIPISISTPRNKLGKQKMLLPGRGGRTSQAWKTAVKGTTHKTEGYLRPWVRDPVLMEGRGQLLERVSRPIPSRCCFSWLDSQ